MELRFLPGIGPARAEALRAAGYADAWDILHHPPRLLGPPPPWCETGTPPAGAAVRMRARVLRAQIRFRGQLHVQAQRADGSPLVIRFFRAAFLLRRMLPGEWFVFEGRTDSQKPHVLNHPAFTHLPGGAKAPLPEDEGCRVAWHLPEGLGERTWKRVIDALLTEADIPDPLGEVDTVAYRDQLAALHKPANPDGFEAARRFLARRECQALAWHLATRRAAAISGTGTAWRWDDEVHQRALARLPFALTPGQENALAEIRSDLRLPTPMYRLLHGDVGSGKTALAFLAALAVIHDGAQVAILAPTAVLAVQHHAFISRCLTGTRVRIGLLTGGSSPEERRHILAGLADGSLHLAIGTHALLGDEVRFHRLGLAIIDEQHRFGVAQRATLVGKSPPDRQADLLLLTATPIPRTLALTAYGDLAVSRIDGRPPGRGAVSTRVQAFTGLDQLAPLVQQASGGCFVICPRKEQDEDGDAIDVGAVAQALRLLLGKSQVAVITGDLEESAKLMAVADFTAGRVRCLVSTTVIEVGIDVPDAHLMLVLDAQRFGLATLHQLRGRIGRGSAPGTCLLLHRADGEDAMRRLAVLETHADGLRIAEADLSERGPGELLGLRQHGQANLMITDLVRDLDLLTEAHQRVREAVGRGERMPAGLGRFLAEGEPMRWLAGG